MNVLRELFSFMVENKKLWMLPVVVIMVLLSGLLILGQGSAVAPLIYAIF
ncbi:MAG: DUF5989 family protein [Rhizobiaceae bacterium]|nr:DUF5989 family protein [Rhizobiaceae bacterium]|tara:strand:- start:292 stop:441 length:150 start_codon:yes stop_codon:yes gene_type:complete